MNMKLDRYNLATELDDYMDKDIYNLREVKIFSRFRKKQRKAEEKSDDNSEDNLYLKQKNTGRAPYSGCGYEAVHII